MLRRAKDRSRLSVHRLEDRTVPSGASVLRWNVVATDAVRDDHGLTAPHAHFGPTAASRALAIVQSAVYDAVNSIDQSYQPYKFQVAAPRTASIDAAVAAAAHDTLAWLYPAYTPRFDLALAEDLAALPAVPAQQGATVGHQIAQLVIASRTNDGSQLVTPYTPTGELGHWESDPLHPGQQALGPGWGLVTPFVMTSGSQFRAPAPPAMTSPEYAAAYNEVLQYGSDGISYPTLRTEEQTQVGVYWGYDGQPGLCSPPRMYNQIAQHIATQQGNTDVQNARFFALVNIAMADAGIAGWESKFYYDLWRPISAIRNGANDGNAATAGNTNWCPYGAPADNGGGSNFTPPFPAYVSGHATFGASVFRIIADFYGTDHIPFTFLSDEFNGVTIDQNGQQRPVLPRHFETLSQAAEENGQSRIYLGIHYSFDKTAGIAQGTAIADYTFSNFLRAKKADRRYATGADAGGGPHVRVVDASNGQVLASFFAFDAGFRGGVRVAMGDVTGDGVADVIAAAGPGGGPHVRVFDGQSFQLVRQFFAYDAGFRGGVNITAGDVDNDGKADIITGADAGGGPHVRVFSGATGGVVREFFAFSAAFFGGVRVAAGDLDGDGKSDIVTGAGPGGGPHVQAYSGSDGHLLTSFFAYPAEFRGGVYVAAGDCDGDGKADIVTGAGSSGTPHVEVFRSNGVLLHSFLALGLPTTAGVRVGCADFNGDGRADLLTTGGPGVQPMVECRNASQLDMIDQEMAYGPSFLGGVYVAGV